MASSSKLSSASTTDEAEPLATTTASLISTLHTNILITHILSRLDGYSLTLLSSTCSDLRCLVGEQTLWRDVCFSLWPSVQHPSLQHVIPTFPKGYHGFFCDSYPILTGNLILNNHGHDDSSPRKLISAVDIRYNNKVIFSRGQELICHHRSEPIPFRVNLLGQKETIPLPLQVKSSGDHSILQRELEEKLELSWIIIDPIAAKNRAVNISSVRPVSVKRQWITGEVEVKYSTVVMNKRSGRWVELEAGIMCNNGPGAYWDQLHVEELWMQVVSDVEGNCLNVKECVGVVTSLMECGERKKKKGKDDYLSRYREYVERKREWRDKERNGKNMKLRMGCYCFGVVTVFLTLCTAVLRCNCTL